MIVRFFIGLINGQTPTSEINGSSDPAGLDSAFLPTGCIRCLERSRAANHPNSHGANSETLIASTSYSNLICWASSQNEGERAPNLPRATSPSYPCRYVRAPYSNFLGSPPHRSIQVGGTRGTNYQFNLNTKKTHHCSSTISSVPDIAVLVLLLLPPYHQFPQQHHASRLRPQPSHRPVPGGPGGARTSQSPPRVHGSDPSRLDTSARSQNRRW